MTIEEYLSIDKMLKGQEEDQQLALALIEKPDVDLFTTMFLFRTNEIVLRKYHDQYPGITSKIIGVCTPATCTRISIELLITLVKTDDHKILFKYIIEQMVVSTIKIATNITIVPYFTIDYDQSR